MTAAHCVYSPSPLTFFSVTFGKVGRQHPGLGGNQRIKKCVYPKDFDPNAARSFRSDYAVCLLSNGKPAQVGTYSLSPNNNLPGAVGGAGVSATTTGYPLEEPWPSLGQLDSVKRPFTATCETFQSIDTSYLKCITSGGQSGSPVVFGGDDNGPVVAILVGGPAPKVNGPPTGTDVLLLNDERVQQVKDWQNGELKP